MLQQRSCKGFFFGNMKLGIVKINNFWHDNWHPVGVLFLKYEHKIIYEAQVDSVLKSKNWLWKTARSKDLVVTVYNNLFLVDLKEEDTAVRTASK